MQQADLGLEISWASFLALVDLLLRNSVVAGVKLLAQECKLLEAL